MPTRKYGFLPRLVLAMVSFVLFGCPAHQQIFKKAEDFKAQRLYESAARSALDALKLKPDYVQAKLLLQEVAPLAYQERLQHAQGFEQAAQFEKALSEYRELRGFIQAVNQYGVRFPTEDLEGKIRSMETGAAEQHY